MSRKGSFCDNAVAENFFGLIKKEVLNHLHFETRAKAELAIYLIISVAGIIWVAFTLNYAMCHRMNLKQKTTVKLKWNLTRLSVVKISTTGWVNKSCGSNVLRESD